ncbi:MAG: glycosyltransferase family 1 protein [Desulfuromonadales bacterium]
MNKPKHCYVDCTDTFFSELNTGIQRVVRNIISRIEVVEDYRGYRFIPVITVGSEILKIDGNLSDNYPITRTVNRLLAYLRNKADFYFASRRKELLPQPEIEQVLPRIDNGRVPSGLHGTIISGCRKIIPFLFRLTMYLDTPFFGDCKVILEKRDTVFFADSFWSLNGLPVLKNAIAIQAKIILLIYDIIPVTHPDFVAEINCKKFNELLPEYLKVVDGVIAISKFSMNEIIGYCQKARIDRDIAFDYFYLGADFAPSIAPVEPYKPTISNLYNDSFFIMVGTIEPRKNHVYVFEAFERLWQEGSEIRLCIVGKVGWKCEAIVKRMTTSGYLNKKLFIFNELNDADLDYLMKRSCAVIIASIVEGFGLPVVEAMHYQKTLLASDIPVFREIGGEYPIYFPLNDNKMLSNLIVRVACGNLKSENHIKGWLSWDESIHVLMDKVIGMSQSPKKHSEIIT